QTNDERQEDRKNRLRKRETKKNRGKEPIRYMPLKLSLSNQKVGNPASHRPNSRSAMSAPQPASKAPPKLSAHASHRARRTPNRTDGARPVAVPAAEVNALRLLQQPVQV